MSELLKTKRNNEYQIAFIKEYWIPNSNNKQKVLDLIEENRGIKRQLQGVS